MSQPLSMDDQVTVRLTTAEALILSNCLDRLNRGEHLAAHIDRAEHAAMCALDNVLEAWNPVIFSENYAKHLQDAKSHITRGTDS